MSGIFLKLKIKNMKVKLTDEAASIFVSDITHQHLVVAIIHNEPCILFRTDIDNGKYSFGILNGKINNMLITGGNGYDISGNHKNLSEFIKKTFETFPNTKMEVFKQGDWKKALQWLINNA